MPLLQETLATVGSKFEHCASRSLVLERFADPTRKGDDRRDFFRRAIDKHAEPHKREAWHDFLLTGLGLKPDDLLFAQLQARLMVNMAGGVMENAGLCLDRLTGIPYIPGSAVKGCARRLAIQLLFESSAGFQPATGSEDLGAKSKRWDDCSQLLFQIARAFGWADQDWKPGSDFAYACGEEWDEIRERATKLLFAAFPNWKKPTGNQPLWKVLPNFAGEVQFLPAYPFSAPAKDLELDVVTCHHQAYYSSTDPNKVALDTEDPIPVVFPAVAPGHVFAFAVLPGRRRGDGLLDIAKQWLKQGLETFGLGAKVAAGYGWFEVGKTSEICRIKIQDELKDKKAKADRASLQADPAVLVDLKTKNEGAMRGLVNQFQTDEQYWTNKDEKFQLSLLVFCTETDTALYEKEKANPKSKILKSLQNLAKKFGRTLP